MSCGSRVHYRLRLASGDTSSLPSTDLSAGQKTQFLRKTSPVRNVGGGLR